MIIIKLIVVNILHNWSHMYYSHKCNIKYVKLIIKYIGFKTFYYAINFYDISSFIVFSNFDNIFISIY